MRNRSGLSRVRQVVRSKTTLKVIGASTAGALVVAMAAAGATEAMAAAPDRTSMVDSALYPQTIAAEDGTTSDNPSDNELSATVGKAVSITTRPDGTPTLNALVTNTQVSGKGSGSLTVPVGTDKGTNTGSFAPIKTENDSIVYDINSDGSEVQNFHGSGGVYKGPLAVTMKVNAWLDGKPISPENMSDISGNVKLDYVFTNHTSQKQKVSYTNTMGEQTTAEVSVPVPMGASFNVVYPNGWADVSAPWANAGFTPAGEQLTGSAILFPPLGGTTATLTVNARAEHATLPASSSTAIPIDLGTFAGGLVLKGGNAVTGLADKGANILGSVPRLLVFLQQLLTKYAGAIQEVDSRYVAPLVSTVESIKINPKAVDKSLNKAQASTLAIGELMSFNSLVDSWNSELLGGLATRFRGASKPVSKIQNAIQGIITDLPQLNKDITTLLGVLGNPAALAQASTDMPNLGTACTAAEATNTYYGTNKTAIKTYVNGLPNGSLKTQLNTLVTALNSQSGFLSIADWPACTELVSKAAPVLPKVNDLVIALTKVKSLIPVLQYIVLPGIIAELNKVAPYLDKIALKLDNPNCPKTIANIKRYGIKNCGAVQALNALATVNRLIGSLMTDKLAPLFVKLEKYVPGLAKIDDVVRVKTAALGAAVAAAPGTLDKYAALLGGFLPKVDTGIAKVDNGVDKIAILNATLIAMNKRAVDGDGAPYGAATGVGHPKTLGAWQIAQNAATPVATQSMKGILLALILFALTATIGTILYVHRKP